MTQLYHPCLLGVASRLTKLLAVAVVLLALGGREARAQWVVLDPANLARNVLHYVARLQQMDMQEQQLAQQLIAMRKLPSPPWRDISQTVSRVQVLMADSRTLGYEIADLENQIQSTFPVNQAFSDWPTERRAQAQRTVATMTNVLGGARAQADGLNDALARLSDMKSQVGSVQGPEAALELETSATVFNAEELVLLRQALMAQTSMQAVYYTNQVNTSAQAAATIDDHLRALTVPGPRRPPVSLRVQP